MKKNKVILGVIGTIIGAGGLSAFDYNFDSRAQAFTKIGFNNTAEDIKNGKYPTDSYASIFLEANVQGNLSDNGFTYGLGGAVAAPVWDPYKVSYNYVNGHGRNSITNGSNQEAGYRYYSLSLAYLGYQYSESNTEAGVKVGRFDNKGLDWFSGRVEGLRTWFTRDNVTVQFDFINRRGIPDAQWFYDFYSVGKKSNNDYDRYFVVTSVNVKLDDLEIKPQLWYHRNDHITPGLTTIYSHNIGDVKAKASVYSLFVLSHKKQGDQYRNDTDKRLGTILIAQEDLSYKNVNFGTGLWKVWGNPDANSGIGRHGNKAKIDVWTADAGTDTFPGYDGTLTDVNSYNAFTAWLYGGQNLGKVTWEVIGRFTKSRSSDEQSIALNVGYEVNKQFSVSTKLEWLNDISKPFERARSSNAAVKALATTKGKIRNDRSHAFVSLNYKF